MDKVLNSVSNTFLNQNFYGFLLLLIAAFFYYHRLDTAATAFSGIGAALMGVSKKAEAPAQQINAETIQTPTIQAPKAGI